MHFFEFHMHFGWKSKETNALLRISYEFRMGGEGGARVSSKIHLNFAWGSKETPAFLRISYDVHMEVKRNTCADLRMEIKRDSCTSSNFIWVSVGNRKEHACVFEFHNVFLIGDRKTHARFFEFHTFSMEVESSACASSNSV